MADYIIDGTILTGIADAIRAEENSTELIVPESMANKVTEGYERKYAEGLSERTYETWTITLTDGSVVEKEVALL